MADVSTNTESLKFDYLFVDGDTRSQTLKNPKPTITTSEITELQNYIRANNLLIGDKAGGTFGRINAVTRITERKTFLDIGS